MESFQLMLKSDLAIFLIQVIIILVTARLIGMLLGRIKQPMVIAEIISGIVLGPSLMGRIPGFTETIFPERSLPLLNLFAQVGLLFFMFLIGLELDPKLFSKNLKSSLIISLTSIAFPFGLGAALSFFIHDLYKIEAPFSSFVLFMGVSMSITAFPVLARILAESGLIRMKVGVLTLSAAATNDMVGWIVLALVVSIVTATNRLGVLWTVMFTGVFLVLMTFVGKYVLQRVADKYVNSTKLPQYVVVGTLVLMCVASLATEMIGIHAMFGSFVLGTVFPKKDMRLAEKFVRKIEDIVVCFLLPLYFVYSGLRTDLGLLNDGNAWLVAFLGIRIGVWFLRIVIWAACTGKIVGGGMAARIQGLNWRESFALGILMNTRGLVELIVLNVGLDLEVLTPTIFAAMVVMALTTTFMTTPLIRWVYAADEIKQMLKEKSLLTTRSVDFSLLLCTNTFHSSNETEANSFQNLLVLAKSLLTYYKNESLLSVIQLMDPVYQYETSFNPKEHKLFLLHRTDNNESLPLLVAAKAKDMGIARVELDSVINASFAQGLIQAASQRQSNLVLLKWSYSVADEKPSLGDNVIHDFVMEAPCSVGIMIDRGVSKAFTKVVLPYVGQASSILGTSALKVARLLAKYRECKEVVVMKIYTKSEKEQGEKEHAANLIAEETLIKKKGTTKFRFVAVECKRDPTEAVKEQLRDGNYNLAIFGFLHEHIVKQNLPAVHQPNELDENTSLLEINWDRQMESARVLMIKQANGFHAEALLQKCTSTNLLFVKHFEHTKAEELHIQMEPEEHEYEEINSPRQNSPQKKM